MNRIEAMKRALEALEELADLVDDTREGRYEPDSFTTQPARTAMTALRTAIEAAEKQEPVARVLTHKEMAEAAKRYTTPPSVATPPAAITQEELQDLKRSELEGWRYADELEQERKRLTAQRQWVGLTYEEIMESWDEIRDGDLAPDFYAVIEAKLREKNLGESK